jgi:hypothetical protein
MALRESNVSSSSLSDKEYDENKTEMLYHTLKQVSTGLGK